MGTRNSELLVVECSGTARSGKGTVVEHLAKTRGAAADETGADYRAITKALIEEDIIEPEMPSEHIQRQLAQVGFDALADYAAARGELVAEHGLSSLYRPEINELVSLVSPISDVRRAVKTGFRRRVEAVRDSGEHDVLVVDGRNLAPTIESVEGTRLLLRTFVSCLPVEAALRECMRSGIDPTSPEGQRVLASIKNRNQNDARRSVDPVRPDADAFDYEHEPDHVTATIQHYADELYGGDFDRAFSAVYDEARPVFARTIKLGEGAVVAAVTEGVQVNFDTTYFRGGSANPKEEMLAVAGTLFDEVVEPVLTK